MSEVTPGPTEAEIEELLGAYALDALEPDEALMVEAHLSECVRCSAEVARHHEVAGLLANSGGVAPDELWDRIAERLDSAGAPSWEVLAARLDGPSVPAIDQGAVSAPVAEVVPIEQAARRRGRWTTGVISAVAVAAAVAALVLGVQVHHLNGQVSALSSTHQTVTQAAQVALENPSTQRVQLTPTATSTAPSGTTVTLVLSATGTGFVIPQGLHALPDEETYQLWGSISGQLISLGVLGADPRVATFTFDSGAKVQAFAITIEQEGGVAQSTHQPLVEGTVQA